MTEDLPVAVALPAPLDARVTAWVERDLGWQVVDPAGPLTPVLALADHASGGLPWIAITDGPPAGEQIRRHLTSGAVDVVGWPQDRLRIPLLAARIDQRRGAGGTATSRLTVAGIAGGVGTSTVALAIGGLLAWSGAAVLVSGDADLVAMAGLRPPADRDRDTGPVRAAPAAVPGVPGLSVVGDGADVTASAWSGDVVVVDAGTTVAAETTLVVSRPDRGLRRAGTFGRPVVVVGEQPLSARDARRLLGAAPLAHLRTSARVARAGLVGRVPAALPGAWLRELREGLTRLGRWSR
ncbi:MAG TPA: hypothetical protein VK891_01625 [Euzebyales bacterium]|nr:hypothetical protein [Euzebyales bacterium]